MANTRKAPPKKVTATPPAKQDEIDNLIGKSETANANSVPRTPTKIDDSVLVRVQSNCHGQLVYDNPRTGSNVVWPRFGDVQSVPMGDLRSMKAGQRKFLRIIGSLFVILTMRDTTMFLQKMSINRLA